MNARESAPQAFARHRAEISNVPLAKIEHVKTAPIKAVEIVLAHEARFMSLRPRMENLRSELDLRFVDECASLARAYWYASSRCAALGDDLDSLPALYVEALALRGLLDDCREMLAKTGHASATNLRPLSKRTSYEALAGDLVKQFAFFEAHWDLAKVHVPISLEQLARAQELAVLLLDEREPEADGSPALREARQTAWRAGTLFLFAYGEVRRAVAMLERGRKHPASWYAPSIYTGRSLPKKRPKPAPAAAEVRREGPGVRSVHGVTFRTHRAR